MGGSSAIGARLGKSMGDRLRAERIFVLASGGRVLTVRVALKSLSVGPALHAPARPNSVHATDQQRSVASAPLR